MFGLTIDEGQNRHADRPPTGAGKDKRCLKDPFRGLISGPGRRHRSRFEGESIVRQAAAQNRSRAA